MQKSISRVLIVKLTSMGDLVHTLPAITDAAHALPGIQFDWVVDRAFAEVPAWHPNVNQTIISAHRAWKKDIKGAIKSGELKKFVHELRAKTYDLIIDAQGSYKSAVITRLAKGVYCGMDKQSVREKFAYLFYKNTFAVPKRQHAIDRLRQLFAASLGYSQPQTPVDYGIDYSKIKAAVLPLSLPEKYVVFVHGVSWESKAWPEPYWRELIRLANNRGFTVLLPWGSQKEHDRALRLAAGQACVIVLPRLGLTQQALILLNAKAVIACDTGLAHIAAALGTSAITLYGATDPYLIGTVGENQKHLVSDFECVKCYKRTCLYPKPVEPRPSCFTRLTPEKVWEEVGQLT